MYSNPLKEFLVLLEGVEILKLMNSWRPFIVILLNFVIGYLVSQGVVQPESHDQLVTVLSDVVGYGIIIFTSVASIIHLFKHPHGVENPQPVVSSVVKTETQTRQVFTEAPVGGVEDPGTPPPLN